MRKAGILILVVGLLITVFTGFNFVTREKVVDVGRLQITRDKDHKLAWSPVIGFAVMIVGGAVYIFGPKKQ